MSTEVNINTNILTWAITRAGFDLHEFIHRVPNVQKWLDGEKYPTVKQLEDFSKKVHLPFGYLFLNEPPKEDLPIPFFRTNNTKTTKVSINIYDTILLMQQRQDWLRDYLKDIGFQELSYVGSFANSNNIKSMANDIRKTLKLTRNWQQFRG